MTRRPDWARRLDWYLAQRSSMPFGWWTNDCVTFAFGAMSMMYSPAPTISVPAWSTDREAIERVKQFGGISHLMQFAQEIVPTMASTGDVALVTIDGRESLGIVMAEVVLGPGETGIARHHRRGIVKTWRCY